jgi:hypothetical protein
MHGTIGPNPKSLLLVTGALEAATGLLLLVRVGRTLLTCEEGLLRAADSAAGSECRAAGKIPGIFVDNSNHQKRSRQDRDKDQPPVTARFLRLVHLACARVLCCVNGGESAIVPMNRWRHRQSYLRRGFGFWV